jgi:glycosyltransferase involved in cell wall biosynthesis
LKILIATADFLPSVGGVAAVVVNLSRALAARGHKLHILHCRPGVHDSAPLANDVHVLGDNIEIAECRLRGSQYPWRKISFAIGAQAAIRKLDAQVGFDVIHWHSLYPDGLGAVLYRGRARKVFTNHTSGFLESLKHPLRKIELRYLVRQFDHVLAPSQELCQASRLAGATSVAYIPNGVDPEQFRPGAISRVTARSELGIGETDFVILLARRFEVKNGLRYFAEAFSRVYRQMPNAVAVFCGPDYDGIEFPATKKILAEAEAHGRVRYAGSVPNPEMPLYYAATDVSVLPSLIEATSITALESMASGLPVIATSVGGLPELIEGGVSGVLAPPRDPDAIAKALLDLYRSPSARASMGEAGRAAIVARFSWARIAQATEQEYALTPSHSSAALSASALQ